MAWYDKIREKREALKMSQLDLAKAVKVSQALIAKIEKGEIEKTRYLPRIVGVLQLAPEDIQDANERELESLKHLMDNAAKVADGPIYLVVSQSTNDGEIRVNPLVTYHPR